MSRKRFRRFWIAPVLACAALAQQTPQQQLPPDEDAPAKHTPAQEGTGKPAGDADLPPDEDAAPNLVKHEFNPVESAHDVKVGDEYFKKGNYRAAAERFRDATEWNQGNADAWLRLGEAEEKRGQVKPARDAYQKYLQLASNAKNAAEVKKRLERLK